MQREKIDYIMVITTPYGHTHNEDFYINEKGEITKDNNSYSGGWKLNGIVHVKRTNEFIPFDKMTPELIKSLDLLYKNGNPQYTVRDWDHGTNRTWGNTQAHGIKYISFLKNLSWGQSGEQK